jgi:hypothetical protein
VLLTIHPHEWGAVIGSTLAFLASVAMVRTGIVRRRRRPAGGCVLRLALAMGGVLAALGGLLYVSMLTTVLFVSRRDLGAPEIALWIGSRS